MDDRKREAGELQKRLQEYETDLSELRRRIGALSLEAPDSGNSRVDQDSRAEYLRLRRELAEQRAYRDSVLADAARIAAAQQERDRERSSLAELEGGTGPLLLAVGRAALASEADGEFLSPFASRLETLASQAGALDDEIEDLRSEDPERGFFDRLGRRAKASLLSSRRAKIEAQADGEIRDAGRGIVERGQPSTDEDTGSALRAYAAHAGEVERRKAAIGELEAELTAIRARLSEAEALKGPKLAVAKAERRIREDEDRLGALYAELGGRVLESPAGKPSPELATLLARAAELVQSAATARRRIEILEASMAIDAVEAELGALAKEAEAHRTKIREREAAIAAIDGKMAEKRAKIAELEAIRAPRSGDAT